MNLINTSFKDLQSGEVDLDLLIRFKKIQFAGEMKNQIDGTYGHVLAEDSEEVKVIKRLYRTNGWIPRSEPPTMSRITLIYFKTF
jgi:hypothetical protein